MICFLYLLFLTYSACMWIKGSNRFKISLKTYTGTIYLFLIFSLCFLENFSFKYINFRKLSYRGRWHLSKTWRKWEISEGKCFQQKNKTTTKNSKCKGPRSGPRLKNCKLFGSCSAAYHMTPTILFLSLGLIVAISPITADIQATLVPNTHIWALLLVLSSQKPLPKDFCHGTFPWNKTQCMILNMEKIWPSLPSFINDLDNMSTKSHWTSSHIVLCL